MKLAVIYNSKTDTTKNMAEIIVEGMNSVDGAEAKAFSIDSVDDEWINESRCVVLGTPIYYASFTAEMKTWLEGAGRKYKLAGKLGGAFATANYVHGGGENGIQEILTHMMVYGMLLYSGGGAHGAPVIHLGPVAVKDYIDDAKETFRLYGQRMATKTMELFK